MVKNLAQIAVTFDDLSAWLRLPAGCVIHAAVPQDAQDIANDRARFIVTGAGCPAHWEGSPAMAVTLMRDTSGRVCIGG